VFYVSSVAQAGTQSEANFSSSLGNGWKVYVVEGSWASPDCPSGLSDVKMKMNVEHVEIILTSLSCFIPRPKTCRLAPKCHLIGLC
jgi:hypothetical protein